LQRTAWVFESPAAQRVRRCSVSTGKEGLTGTRCARVQHHC
jgi:hypothetical protein